MRNKPANSTQDKPRLFLKAFALVLLSSLVFPTNALRSSDEADDSTNPIQQQYGLIFEADVSDTEAVRDLNRYERHLLSMARRINEVNRKLLELRETMKEALSLVNGYVKTSPTSCFNSESKRITASLQNTYKKMHGIVVRAGKFNESPPKNPSVIEKTTAELKEVIKEFHAGLSQLNKACDLTR